MFTNTPFDAIAKTMKANAEKFNPAAAHEAFKPVTENLKAWADLAQKQAQIAQSAIAETVESFKSVKEPQAAFEAMKASAENGIAIATKNLKDVTALGVAHFHSGVDALEKTHPAPDAFANVGKGLKTAATAMENALDSVVKSGTAAVKKARAG
jgi:TPR repeat protein